MTISKDDPDERFAALAEQWIAVCVTAARPPRGIEDMARAFAIPWPQEAKQETLDETDVDPEHTFKVRFGVRRGWSYAVEHFTARGRQEETLKILSAGGGEALALSHNPNSGYFSYAADGAFLTSFDIVATTLRRGQDPDRFEEEMARAGMPSVPGALAAAARFVRLAFGLELEPEMIEMRLPSYLLAWPPSTVADITAARPASPSPPPPTSRSSTEPGLR